MRPKRVYMTVSSDLATDNRVHRSCTALLELGYDVTLIGRRKKSSPELQARPYKTLRLNLTFEKGALFYAALNMRLLILLLFKKLDFLFANDLDTLPAAYLISKIKRKPLLYDSHELFTEVPELSDRPKIQQFWKRIEAYILPRLKEMITVNDAIAKIFSAQYGIPVRAVRNVPQKAEAIQALSKSELGLAPKQKMLIIQGSGLNVQRGIEEAVLAMQYLADTVLFLVGDGDVIPEVKKMVTQHALTDKVRFIPRIPYHELLRYTAAADLGLALDKPLSLNYQLALPNKVFDYIQAGTPILANDLVEIGKLIKTHDCGKIIRSSKPLEIAQEIASLLNDTQRMQELAANCRKAAQSEHWGKDQEILKQVIRRVFI